MHASDSKKKQEIIDLLSSIRLEIQTYPRPIAGCDDQFNSLLSERDRLTQKLSRLVQTGQDSENL
jgi:hypothetical protein